jgi:iron complex outermembrane receptor protein
VIAPDLSVGPDPAVPGSGAVIATRGRIGYAPIELATSSAYYGVFATDTLDLSRRVSITAGGRLNVAAVDLKDATGADPALTGDHAFSRLDPSFGAVWRLSPAVTAYGDYSEANRAPTPLELGCSDPQAPCLLENALVSDPPLKQVTARTWEAGVRGERGLAGGRLNWRLSLFQTDLSNDIVALASPIQGRGYYANIPGTRRRGAEASLEYRSARAEFYLGLSRIEATYRFAGDLPSPNNPFSDANGDVHVVPGDRIGGIPANRLKAGAAFTPTARLTLGADVVAVGDQRLQGDEANQDRKLGAYWTAAVHAAYEIGDGLEAFARIDNLFDRRFQTFGTYFDPDGVGRISPPVLPDQPDPRSFTPAPPRAFTIGLRRAW